MIKIENLGDRTAVTIYGSSDDLNTELTALIKAIEEMESNKKFRDIIKNTLKELD